MNKVMSKRARNSIHICELCSCASSLVYVLLITQVKCKTAKIQKVIFPKETPKRKWNQNYFTGCTLNCINSLKFHCHLQNIQPFNMSSFDIIQNNKSSLPSNSLSWIIRKKKNSYICLQKQLEWSKQEQQIRRSL